eukprot:364955-Chlamydomonas_euryale.AAC.9
MNQAQIRHESGMNSVNCSSIDVRESCMRKGGARGGMGKEGGRKGRKGEERGGARGGREAARRGSEEEGRQ